MHKEEILERSRKENKDRDERESFALDSAGRTAAIVGMLVCCFVAALQVLFTDSVSFESWLIYFSILGSLFLTKYLKLRERHELLLAVLYGSLFVFFLILFIFTLVR